MIANTLTRMAQIGQADTALSRVPVQDAERVDSAQNRYSDRAIDRMCAIGSPDGALLHGARMRQRRPPSGFGTDLLQYPVPEGKSGS